MRALFLNTELNYSAGQRVTIDGDAAHHLLRVVRIEKNEKLLIYNGTGIVLSASVELLEKKSCHLLIEERRVEPYLPICDVAVGLTKKEAWEDVLRFAVELRIGKIIPIITEYSQRALISPERSKKIIENAIIQSNNAYGVKTNNPVLFQEIREFANSYEQVIYLSERTCNDSHTDAFKKNKRTLLVIGPEGGFSLDEDRQLRELPNIFSVHFPTCIMRVPTALCVAAGYFLGRKEVDGVKNL